MKYYSNIILILLVFLTSSKVLAEKEAKTELPLKRKFNNLHVVEHPLISDKLTTMRNKETPAPIFRQSLKEIAMIMGYEVTKSLRTAPVEIETPITKMTGTKLNQEVVIVPILRAGLGMAEGVERLVPGSAVAHIGIYRDPETKEAMEYYFKTPPIDGQLFIVVDPMLATGNTAIHAVKKLRAAGVSAKQIVFLSLVAAPEGVAKFQEAHPTIKIYTASLDEKLNENAYIVPGLGDAGDRIFGTK